MIAYLQMFVFMPLIEIDFPMSCMLIYEQLIKVASFDLLSTDNWFPEFFSLPDVPPVSPYFENLDLDVFVLCTLGTLFVFLVFAILQFILYWVVYAMLLCCKIQFLTKLLKHLKKEVFWGSFINLLQQGYIEFCFAVIINISKYSELEESESNWASWGCYLNNIVAVIFGLIILVYPVWL